MAHIRKYIRGYNHAELIAEEISKKCNITILKNILYRSKTVRRQVKTKSRQERLDNQRNSFSVHASTQGMSIILIDDVTTTGATWSIVAINMNLSRISLAGLPSLVNYVKGQCASNY